MKRHEKGAPHKKNVHLKSITAAMKLDMVHLYSFNRRAVYCECACVIQRVQLRKWQSWEYKYIYSFSFASSGVALSLSLFHFLPVIHAGVGWSYHITNTTQRLYIYQRYTQLKGFVSWNVFCFLRCINLEICGNEFRYLLLGDFS